MKNKVIHLGDERRKRKRRTLEEAAKVAYGKFCDPDFLATQPEEPLGLASGKTNPNGGFVRDDEDDLLADAERDAENDK